MTILEHVCEHVAHLAMHKFIISAELMGTCLDLDGHFSRWPMYPIPLASVITSHFFYGPFLQYNLVLLLHLCYENILSSTVYFSIGHQ